jgi:transcriptional regulator with XRE-family HTH domain
MKFNITEAWLRSRLARADDSDAAAGGTTPEELQQDAQRRTVTPQALAHTPTPIGKVVRFIREQRGFSREDLAQIADVDVSEIIAIETVVDYQPNPRAATYIANALGLSPKRFQEQVGLRLPRASGSAEPMQYAAHSRTDAQPTEEEFETIRALVKALSDRDP